MAFQGRLERALLKLLERRELSATQFVVTNSNEVVRIGSSLGFCHGVNCSKPLISGAAVWNVYSILNCMYVNVCTVLKGVKQRIYTSFILISKITNNKFRTVFWVLQAVVCNCVVTFGLQ